MLVCELNDNLQLDDQGSSDKEISEIASERSPVFIKYRQWMLLDDLDTSLAQTMRQRVFVDLLQMSVPMVPMNRRSRLSHQVT